MPTRSPPAAPGRTDTVPAMLTPGEYVLKRDAVKRIGVGKLNRLNQGYQDGGEVEPAAPRATWVGGTAPRATFVAPPAPGATPAVTTGPATQDISAPFPTTIRTLSYGPPVDKPTHDVLYGALTDQQGNQVRLGTQDIAMSPNLYKQYGLKLGQNIDVLDMDGNVIYPNQRLADYSYYHPNKPTTDTIELWGRPDVGNVQIRLSALQGPSPQPVGSAANIMGGYNVPPGVARFQAGGLVAESGAMRPLGYLAALKMPDGMIYTGGTHDSAYSKAGEPRYSPGMQYGFAHRKTGHFITHEEADQILDEAVKKGYKGPGIVGYQEGGPVTNRVKAALQTAGQYARFPDVLTPENAPQYGLDRSTGFIARGTPIAPVTDPRAVAAPAQPSAVPTPTPSQAPTPAPTPDLPWPTPLPPETTPPPGMAPGLGTTTGAPIQAPKEEPVKPDEKPPAWAKTEPPEKAPEKAPETEAAPDWAKTEPPEKPPDWAKTVPPEAEQKPAEQKPAEPSAPTQPEKPTQAPTQAIPTSNNDYYAPAGAHDFMGIKKEVWQNAMSEEGPKFGLDPGTRHMSVFGLWQGTPDVEGDAYNVAHQYGANSLEAYNAVTAAWTKKFLGQSQPWKLTSPGLQELVIADSQHVGGGAARAIIDKMGGWDAINKMDPKQAIAQYTSLRYPLWKTNPGRVVREGRWALEYNDTIAKGAPPDMSADTSKLIMPPAKAAGDGAGKGKGKGDGERQETLVPMVPSEGSAPAPAQAQVPQSVSGGAFPGQVPPIPESPGGFFGGFPFMWGGGAQEEAAPAVQTARLTPVPPEQPPAGPPISTSLTTTGIKPANVLGVTTVGGPPAAPSGQLALPAPPPAAPSGAPSVKVGPLPELKAPPPIVPQQGVDPSVIKGLMKQGFTREQALAVAAKATVSKPGAGVVTGAASFRAPTPPIQQAPPAAPSRPAPPTAQAPAQPSAQPGGLPPTPQERRGQIAAHAEQAIAEKRPMHISYISAPKEAARYPTRESRTIQYEEHSPEARLMGSTVGQLVGHSLIPVESKVTKEGEPYVLGLSTNVMANNHRHINEKLAAMGRNSPYPEFNQKFFNDVEGYLGNLNAGHTGTGQGIQVGTEEHPVSPDLSHVPHKLTRHEADFINLVLNNTKAMAQHKRDPALAAQAQAVRELARAHGTLITEAGETNRMRHEINQSDPKWSQRVLEPSVRSFKSGLIHEVHPSEATLPETIRPGPEYQQMTSALHHAIQRGRPDIPIAASLHSNLQHNANINAIERAFSEGKITEEHARQALRGIGEDPDEYRYISGSGGLITPYEENPEAITPEEHNTLKDNLRKQWISGKMDVENYRRKAAEVPLPEIAKRQSTPTQSEAPAETEAQAPQPKAPKKVPQTEPEAEAEIQESEEGKPSEPAAPSAPKQPTAKSRVPNVEKGIIPSKQKTVPGAEGLPHAEHDPTQPAYLRVGRWDPKTERSQNYARGTWEPGVSVYDLDENHKPVVPPEGEWAEEDLHDRLRGEEAKLLVQGQHVGIGHDGEPLLKKVRVVGPWPKEKPSTEPPKAPVKPEEPPEAPTAAAPMPSKPEEPEEAPAAPSAPTGPPKKKAKTPEQRAVEEQVRGEAAADRNDIGEGDQRKINRLQKLARGWTKLNAKLHDLSAHAHLTGQKNFKSNDLKKTEIGEHFDSTTDGGNPALDYNKPEHREHAATAILHDIMHALAGTKHALNKEGKPSSAFGWYDRAVRKTMRKMGQFAPEILTDPEHALAFKLGLAVTSQGQDVHPNAESAWNIYRYWRQHGELPESRSVFGGGPKAEQMENNLAKLNDLWDKHGHHELQRMLMERGTVKDLAQKYGLDFGTEKVGNKVNGAMFMGPKIGAFFSNLNGDFSPTTMDLWFSRTLNRMAGNMFKFRSGAMLNDRTVKGKLQKSHVNEMEDLLNKGQASGMTPEREAIIRKELAALRGTPEADLDRKKALEVAPELHNWAAERHRFYQKQNTINGVTRGYHPALKTRENVLGKKLDLGVNELSDAPRNASERDNWRSIMTSVEGKLKDAGVKLTNADKQALLWFVEKNLFMHAGSPQKVAADYLDAAYMLGHKIKNGEMPGLDHPIAKVARRSRTLVAAAKPEEEFEEEEAA